MLSNTNTLSGQVFAEIISLLQTAVCLYRKIPVLIPLASLALTIVISFLVWQHFGKAKRRSDGLFRLLDLADDMERLLNLSQKRMQVMQSVVERVPSDIGAVATAALDSSEKIKAVKRDLLQHRLWIQQHSETASLLEIEKACTALSRSRDRIAEQLEALENAGADLAQATATTELAAVREPASLRRSEE
jgi:hypothetical protein